MATSNLRTVYKTIIITFVIALAGGMLVWRLNSSVGAPSSDVTQAASSNQASGNDETVTVNVTSSGYNPSSVTVKQGEKVNLQLITNNTGGCIRAFTIPSLGVSRSLPTSGTTTVQFVAKQKGQITFQCSMGMFRGVINVI